MESSQQDRTVSSRREKRLDYVIVSSVGEAVTGSRYVVGMNRLSGLAFITASAIFLFIVFGAVVMNILGWFGVSEYAAFNTSFLLFVGLLWLGLRKPKPKDTEVGDELVEGN